MAETLNVSRANRAASEKRGGCGATAVFRRCSMATVFGIIPETEGGWDMQSLGRH